MMREAHRDKAENLIEGRQAVREAFQAGVTVDKLYLLDGCHDGPLESIRRAAKKTKAVISYVTKERLDQLSATGHHQGVIAKTAEIKYASLEDVFLRAEKLNEKPFIILLDNVEDPHNLGAIVRTANVAGAHGVIIPERRSATLTAAALRASAGAALHTPVVRVTNLSDTILALKERGMWFVAADMDGAPMYELDLTGPVGLVIGNEGAGVSPRVKKSCDLCASIPVRGEISSLNASVAAGVLAYEIVRQRTAAGQKS